MKVKNFESAVEDGKAVSLLFKKPNQGILSRGDFVYRTEFSKAIRAGIMTTAEANKLLSERGIWSEERDIQESELRVKISDLETKIADASDEEALKIYSELKALRVKLTELTQMYNSITENTAESVASESRTQFFASECSVYKDSGKRVFASFDDFKSRLDEQITSDCYRNALISNWEDVLGISIDELTSNLPEDEWLKLRSEKDAEEARSVDPVDAVLPEDEPATDIEAKPKGRGRKKKTA